MNKTGIRKVKVLQGMAKKVAEDYGLKPDDLVILTVTLEKVIGDPVSYLLAQVEDGSEAVLFHCYECDVDLIQLGGGDYQCPRCNEIFQFEIPQSSAPTAKRGELNEGR